ncbi:MAG: tetratricopeptide repeat protein, partial [Spirochaetota bacterium]
MNRKHIITFILYCTCTLHAQMPPEEAVTFFYTQNDKSGRTGIVRGRVLSLGAREVADEELRQLAQSKTKVTVRLADKEGIIPGNTLYIINERNLIVSSFEVTTVFQSASFGYLLVGYGNFRRVQENFRVVQHREDNAARYAYVHKARGDYFSQNGDDAQAMLEYEKAIRKNRGHAESHVELGYIYLKDGVYEYALREFSEAYKTRGFIHDRE